MAMLLRHPYSGLFWTEEYIDRYAALGDDSMSREEAVQHLVEHRGFERVQLEDIETDSDDLLSALVENIGRIAENTGRIADNTGRTASGLDSIANQAPLLTPPIGVEKVAELAGVTSKTVYRWKEEGLLKPLADNKPLLFDQAEFHNFIRQRRRRRK